MGLVNRGAMRDLKSLKELQEEVCKIYEYVHPEDIFIPSGFFLKLENDEEWNILCFPNTVKSYSTVDSLLVWISLNRQ